VHGFDVVVVGGGSAGCVVAARVAATGASVLLVEAGPDLRGQPTPEMRDAWALPQVGDWGYQTEADGDGNTTRLRRGRLLGGTSHLTRFALRASPADYDEWETLGNAGWGFAEVLPYFRRLEADAEFGTEAWHGSSGPIPITRYPELEPAPVHLAARETLEAAGFARVEDHNRPGAVGVGPMPMSSRNAVRVTTADAYLPLTGLPASLTIRAETQVATLLMDGRTAAGVRLLDGGTIRADRVVLCAGVYGSPAILLRSGIGPAAELRALDITPLVDLPGVGANLADHPAVELELAGDGTARDAPVLHTAATFASHGDGGPPDLMIWLSDPTPPEDPAFIGDVVLLKPRSRGSVRLRSADPAEPPIIELPGLREADDVARLAAGYERAREAFALPSLGRADVLQHVRASAYSLPHTAGTCALGVVVDASGRVHGVEGLWIADASIMPAPISGFTHLPTIMIAERLSELIAALLASGSP
jgi:choline dehydrogenase-like flavoprotein